MSNNLESHVKSIEYLVRKEYFQVDISGVIIEVTGDNPFSATNIACLIRKLGGMIHNDDDVLKQNQKRKYIVVGREDYDEDFLLKVINSKVDVIFLAQESLINHILFGVDINNSYDKNEINNHPGLSCIDKLGGFPSSIPDSAFAGQGGTSRWKERSFLRNYGYHTGMLPSQRQERLIVAVREEGIDPVVDHISWLARLNSGNKNIKDAVNTWVRDLDWLRHTYRRQR